MEKNFERGKKSHDVKKESSRRMEGKKQRFEGKSKKKDEKIGCF